MSEKPYDHASKEDLYMLAAMYRNLCAALVTRAGGLVTIDKDEFNSVGDLYRRMGENEVELVVQEKTHDGKTVSTPDTGTVANH